MKEYKSSIPKERQWRTANPNDKFTDKSILFRHNLLIGNPIFLTVIYFLILFLGFFLVNYLINIFDCVLNNIPNLFKDSPSFNTSSVFAAKNIFLFNKKLSVVYIILAIVIAVSDAVLIIKIHLSYKDLNVGQKGAERFTTIEEAREQYRAIPMKETEWESETGGVIITRDGDNFLIDEEPGHNLIIGTTRSGKDQMVVEPNIETNSRCTGRPSFIINDPKCETYRRTRKLLIERGYKDILINLSDPNFSDRINSFSRIIELYKKGDKDNSFKEARSFAYSIFWDMPSDRSTDEGSTWNNAATDIFTALIIANVIDCIELDKKERAEAEYAFTAKKVAFNELPTGIQNNIVKKFRSGLLNANNSEHIPPDIEFEFEPVHEKQCNLFSILTMFRLLAESKDEKGISALDKYFTARPTMDVARRFFATAKIPHARTSTSIYFTMLSKLNGFAFDNIARMTACSDFELKDIGFGDVPIALFIAAPDYDNSNHFLITAIIQQIYYVLSDEATKTPTGKCRRAVWHYINEFGNCPPFSHIAQMVSVGAGRNIFYNFIVQDFAQMDERYNEKIAKTIKNNCHNHFFIKTLDYATAEEFSKVLGKETKTNLERIGRRFATDKTFTEREEEQELLNPNRLMDLLEGEMVVKRIMKRKTLDGKDAVPYPIYNTGENKIPYAYTYLNDTLNYKPCTIQDVRSNWPEKADINSFTFDIVSHYNNVIKTSDNSDKKTDKRNDWTVSNFPCYIDLLYMLLEDGIYLSIDLLRSIKLIDFMQNIKDRTDLSEERKKEYMTMMLESKEILKKQFQEVIC